MSPSKTIVTRVSGHLALDRVVAPGEALVTRWDCAGRVAAVERRWGRRGV